MITEKKTHLWKAWLSSLITGRSFIIESGCNMTKDSEHYSLYGITHKLNEWQKEL